MRFLATHGVQEKILDRYKDKLDRKARELVSHFSVIERLIHKAGE